MGRSPELREWISSIDTHTGGEPTRNVLSGVPRLPGETMIEKARYFSEHFDTLRRRLLFEPRGNEVMSGTLLTAPCRAEADVGVVFIEVGGYLPMCGHDTIGLCTALVEAKKVRVHEPETCIVLDTPAGLVRVTVFVQAGHATAVCFRGVPSFVVQANLRVPMPSGATVTGDLAYGGNLYFSVDAAQLGLTITNDAVGDLVRTGIELRETINRQVAVDHPALPYTDCVTHVQFTAPPRSSGATAGNAVIIPPGAVDRSACGTGTAARMAILHAQGSLPIGESFVHEGPLGTTMNGVIVECVDIRGTAAIIPEISGRAFVTGYHRFVSNADDPLDHGFLLGRGDEPFLCTMERERRREEEIR